MKRLALRPSIHLSARDDLKDKECSLPPPNVRTYTDGSCIGGHVGAAAVYPEKGRIRDAYMGTNATLTVYAAELRGINLALTMAKEEVDAGAVQRCINVFADNQAAIRSLTRPEGRSGSYILRQIVERIGALQTSGHKVTLRWMPSHKGKDGNEAADIAAKKATGRRGGPASGPRATPPQKLYSLHAPLKV